jgi:hypothetical protein
VCNCQHSLRYALGCCISGGGLNTAIATALNGCSQAEVAVAAIPVVLGIDSIGALDNITEPQVDQSAHGLVPPWRTGGVHIRCRAVPFGMLHVYAWYSSSSHSSE